MCELGGMRLNLLKRGIGLAAICIIALLAITTAVQAEAEGPIPVKVVQHNGQYMLLRGGKPFVVHPVSGFDELDAAVEAGANTIRTWATKHLDDGRLLDEAHKRGMGVVHGSLARA